MDAYASDGFSAKRHAADLRPELEKCLTGFGANAPMLTSIGALMFKTLSFEVFFNVFRLPLFFRFIYKAIHK